MNNELLDLRKLDYRTLSEAKAKLSECIRQVVSQKRRLVVTTNGLPTAVMLSYQEYLNLLGTLEEEPASEKVITMEEWRKGAKKRAKVRDSILSLFDMKRLSRKGQKKYKKDLVASFQSS